MVYRWTDEPTAVRRTGASRHGIGAVQPRLSTRSVGSTPTLGLDDRPRSRPAGVHENTPTPCYVGRPGYEERHNRWEQYAFDPSEKPVVGKREREWIAAGPTEVRCVQEMARCLGELKAGRWPK